jgi:hypothetical protein
MAQANEEFEAAIAPLEKAYHAVTIRYLAGRHDPKGPWRLMQASILLESHRVEQAPRTFASPRLRAGFFTASGPDFRPAEVIATLLRGEFPTETDPIAFIPRDTGGYDLHLLRSYPDVATNTQNRMGLRVTGGWVQNAAPLHEVGWELLGAEPPFETLQELANAFGLGPVQQQSVTVEIWTNPVLHFTEETGVAGNEAQIAIWLAPALDPAQVRIGRKLRHKTDSDGSLAGSTLAWTSDAQGYRTIHRFTVTEHQELLCTLGYSDSVQGFTVLRDGSAIANHRRLLYETVDAGLTKLKASLAMFKEAEQNSVEFELLIERLFWLAGFNPLYLGKDKKTERAGDIVALTPEEDVLLIECTTGILKQDKRSQLLRRAQKLRDALAMSPDGPRTVIPLLVTCLPWREAQNDADAAQASGIAIFSYEDIADLIAATTAPPDPAGIVGQLRQRLAIAAMVQSNTIAEFPTD